MRGQFSQEEISDVLSRAEEIHQRSGEHGPLGPDAEVVIRAAEEAGLPREAVEAALRERFGLLSEPPTVGALVFARSKDDEFYVAEVLDSGARGIHVRFLCGGDVTLPLADLRPCSFLPGSRVVCQWPMWGWWTCEVLSYDPSARRITVSDGWGSTEKFSIADIVMEKPKKPGTGGEVRAKVYTWLFGLASGGVVGTVVTWLLMR